MKIELKNISYSERMSEETSCFSADLWVDGKKIGEVSNRGTGGCDDFHGDRAAYDAADAWCKANLPRWSLDDDRPDLFPTDLEMHVASLLSEWLARKDMKRLFAKSVIFKLPEKPGLYELKVKIPMKPTDPRLIAHVTAKHPGAVILSTLPEAEALGLYRAAGAA